MGDRCKIDQEIGGQFFFSLFGQLLCEGGRLKGRKGKGKGRGRREREYFCLGGGGGWLGANKIKIKITNEQKFRIA